MPLCSIEEAVADIRQGKMVILVDDEGRENEGDLTMAAALYNIGKLSWSDSMMASPSDEIFSVSTAASEAIAALSCSAR